MSTVAVKSLKVPNARSERGSGTKKRDHKTGPPELGADGENTSLVSRQSSTTTTSSDHNDACSNGTKDTPQTTPRPVSATKTTVGGLTKPAGSFTISGASRSPLSKINVPSSSTSKSSKRPEGGDPKADSLLAKASQNRTKSAVTPPVSDHGPKGSSAPTSDIGGGSARTAGTSRQGVPNSASTRIGSAPVPRSSPGPSATRGGGASRAAPAKKAGTGAAAKVKESHKLESPQSSLSETKSSPESTTQEPTSVVPGPDSVPNGLEVAPKDTELHPIPKESESKLAEPGSNPINPEPVPKQLELSVQWIALTEERDRLAKALVDKEEEFRAREQDLLNKLQAASGAQTEERCSQGVGDSVDGAVQTEEEEEEENVQNGHQDGTFQDPKKTADGVLTTACKEEEDGEKTAALLKVEQMEAIHKEREMVILRGEQEIARLQLELQTSEDQLVQCRRQLESAQSQLAGAMEQLRLAGSLQNGTLKLQHIPKAGHIESDSIEDGGVGMNGAQTNGQGLDQANGPSNGHDITNPKGCQETDASQMSKGSAEPTSGLVQRFRALLSDNQEGVELHVGTGEEAALLEVIREYQGRMREKLRDMEERCRRDLTAKEEAAVEVKSGSKGKLFRSDVEPISTEQEVVTKRIKPADDLPSVPPISRLVKKARRRSGGNGSGTRPRSLDGPQTTEPPSAGAGLDNTVDSSPSPPGDKMSPHSLSDLTTSSPSVDHTPSSIANANLPTRPELPTANGLPEEVSKQQDKGSETCGAGSIEVATQDTLSTVRVTTGMGPPSAAVEDAHSGGGRTDAVEVDLVPRFQSAPLVTEPLSQTGQIGGVSVDGEVQGTGNARIDSSGLQKSDGTSDDGMWISLVIPRAV